MKSFIDLNFEKGYSCAMNFRHYYDIVGYGLRWSAVLRLPTRGRFYGWHAVGCDIVFSRCARCAREGGTRGAREGGARGARGCPPEVKYMVTQNYEHVMNKL